MIKRILEKLFHLEPVQCETCAALRLQIEYQQVINKELVETITALLKPAPIINTPERVNQPIQMQHSKIWGRRRQQLEENDRRQAALMDNKLVAKPDAGVSAPESKVQINENQTNDEVVKNQIQSTTIEDLERELGVVQVVSAEGEN